MGSVVLNFVGGIPFQGLYEVVKVAVHKSRKFKTQLVSLEFTLRCIHSPTLEQIRNNYIRLNLQTDTVVDLKQKVIVGKARVDELSELSMWSIRIWGNCCNCIGPDYAKELDELNRTLWCLLELLQLEQVRNMGELLCLARGAKDKQDDLEKKQGELLTGVRELGEKVDALLATLKEKQDTNYTMHVSIPGGVQQAPSSSRGGQPDPALGVVFQKLVDVVVQVNAESMMFEPLRNLKSTLYCLQPLIEEIAEHGRVVHLPKQEVERVTMQLVNGIENVLKLSKVRKHANNKYDFTNKILNLDEYLQRLFVELKGQVERNLTEAMDSAKKLEMEIKKIEAELPELPSPSVGFDILNLEGLGDEVELGHSTPSSSTPNPQFSSMRQLPSSCEEESRQCNYITERVLEDRKEMALKQVHAPVKVVMKNPARDRVPINSDKNHDEENNYDPASLFHQLGRDISVHCLVHFSRADYGSLAMLSRSFHSLIRSGELYRLRRILGIVEHWLYLSCHLSEWWAFNPDRCRWMPLPKMKMDEVFMCSDKECLAVGTELLVFGREIMSHVIYKYSLCTHRWSLGGSMSSPRCLFASASSGEIAILAGGCDQSCNVLSTAELYNSETGTWLTLPSMNVPRKMSSAVFMDGKFYVVGGIGRIGEDSSAVLSSGEVYDLERRTWTLIPNMHPVKEGGKARATNMAGPPMIAVVNNILYAADYAEEEVRKYDKERNVWVSIGRLPQGTDSWVCSMVFQACGNRLIVISQGNRLLSLAPVEVNSWVPDEGPLQWNLISMKESGGSVSNCAVMGC